MTRRLTHTGSTARGKGGNVREAVFLVEILKASALSDCNPGAAAS